MRANRKHQRVRSRLIVLTVAVLASFMIAGTHTPAVSQSSGFTFVDLGTLGGEDSWARGINDSGQVVGYSLLSDGTTRAFLYSGGPLVDLGTLGGSVSEAYGINDLGHVTGRSWKANGSRRAFLWTPGGTNGVPTNPQMRDLGVLLKPSSYSYGYGLNNLDEVVGEGDRSQSFIQHPFLWRNGKMTDLGTLGGGQLAFANASGVNDFGQVTGSSQIADHQPSHPFLWQSGKMYDLGSLGGYAGGRGINSYGQVVGGSGTPSGDTHALLWTPNRPNGTSGNLMDLHVFAPAGFLNSNAAAIDSFGHVVGSMSTGSGPGHAFLWTPGSANGSSGGTFVDLNAYAPLGYVLVDARGINDTGQIVGDAQFTDASGARSYRAFLLTP